MTVNSDGPKWYIRRTENNFIRCVQIVKKTATSVTQRLKKVTDLMKISDEIANEMLILTAQR